MNCLVSWSLCAASLPLACASLLAQDTSDFFDPNDIILPVAPELPDSIEILATNPSFDPATGIASYNGAFDLRADNGSRIRGNSARYDSKKKSFSISGDIRLSTREGARIKARRATFDSTSGLANLTGPVSLIQPAQDGSYGIQIFSQAADINTRAKTATLSGNVSIYSGPVLHRGEKATYDYSSRKFTTENLRTGLDPILLEAGSFRSETIDGRQAYVGENASITTHDRQDPNYWIRANKTTVFPDEKVVFKNLKVYVGETPVFWLPYLSQPLDKDLGYLFIPGARSSWGPFLLNRYGIMLGGKRDPITGENRDAWLLSQFHLDILSRRGVGLGIDLRDTRREDNENLTGFSYYYLNDLDPSQRRAGEPRGNVNEDRFKVQLRDKIRLAKMLGHNRDISVDAFVDITKLSDRFYLEDFEPRTFRTDPEPDNVIGISAQNASSQLSLHARLQPNSFYQTATRLPELTFDQVRRPVLENVLGGGWLHEGHASVGIYEEDVTRLRETELRAERDALLLSNPGSSRIAELDGLLASRSFTRFHLYQELSRPFKIGDHFNIVPRVGLGYTTYESVEGPISSTDRTHFYAGLEASTKFSKRYPHIVNERWGVDGLLHIVQPYVSASWLRSDSQSPLFNGIDTLTPSTRPRLRTPGRFSAIDDLSDWGVFRLGMQNRLLTSRDGGSHDWLTLDTYIDAFSQDPEFDRKLSNLYNDFTWRPVPWVNLSLETQLPISREDSGFSEISTNATFMPTRSTEISIAHRFLKDNPILEDSNLIDFSVYHRLNSLWGFEASQRWELEDGALEVQSYNIQRDFQSWIISAGLILRDNRTVDEYGFLLSFILKDFPSVELPLSIDSEQ